MEVQFWLGGLDHVCCLDKSFSIHFPLLTSSKMM